MIRASYLDAQARGTATRAEGQLEALSRALEVDDWPAAERLLGAFCEVIVQVDATERGPILQRAQATVEGARSHALGRRQDIANRCAVLQLGKTASACYRSVSR